MEQEKHIQTGSPVNVREFIASTPQIRKIEVDDLLFAEFECPMEENQSKLWWDTNIFAHILVGSTVLKTPVREYTLNAGDSAFAKKGSVITRDLIHEGFCEILIFVTDEFIRGVVRKYEISLVAAKESARPSDTVIPLNTDDVLHTYFRSLLTYFHQDSPPPGKLLRLKFEELLLSILSGPNHLPLKEYFNRMCKSTRPGLSEIMEANFFSNLTLDEFARLCGRSLTAFKAEFSEIYKTTPGKWLLWRRLEHSRFLLETTDEAVDQICFNCGFENTSHFTRVFRNKYGVTPGRFRTQHQGVHNP